MFEGDAAVVKDTGHSGKTVGVNCNGNGEKVIQVNGYKKS